MPEPFRLLACRSCGSAIVEAAFRVADLPYQREEIDYEKPGPGRDRLRSLNPLGQIPTLIMPDGSIMTETAAIIMMIDDRVPEAGLVPPPGAADRNAFLRWLVFLVAAIYPTFTYGDEPEKWLPDSSDATALKAATDRHREASWRQVEAAVAPNPWFLGERFSALDLYVGAMTQWRPRQDWFRAECPKLAGLADRVREMPVVAELFREEFG